MASDDPKNKNRPSLYPIIDESNPDSISPVLVSNPNSNSCPPLYPSIPIEDLSPVPDSPSPSSRQETLISIPGAIVHLIDNHYSVQLASGVLSIVRLWQNDSLVAVLARVSDDLQWPLLNDEAAVKVDDSRYFFSLPDPDLLNYGLTFASKGQKNLLQDLDSILETYCAFSVHRVPLLDESFPMETSPEEDTCGAYWTTLAPNVEDYSGKAAKLIASGSGQLIKGILWCGDVTVDRLNWGNVVLKKRLSFREKAEISPITMKRIKRAKRVTKMTQKVANGVLSGVVKVSEKLMTSVANSKAGKKFFDMLPGEILLASLDGFSKICDAAEVAGKSVLSTSSTVTADLVTHRYGEEAGEATEQGMDAAGHAFGAVWAAFKIRKALNPKNVVKVSTMAKSAAKAAAADYKSRKASY